MPKIKSTIQSGNVDRVAEIQIPGIDGKQGTPATFNLPIGGGAVVMC